LRLRRQPWVGEPVGSGREWVAREEAALDCVRRQTKPVRPRRVLAKYALAYTLHPRELAQRAGVGLHSREYGRGRRRGCSSAAEVGAKRKQEDPRWTLAPLEHYWSALARRNLQAASTNDRQVRRRCSKGVKQALRACHLVFGSIPHGTGPHEHPSACRPPHGLPSAYTRRKLTERREVYATQKKSGRAVSFPPLDGWREVHQFPFPRTSSPAATVDHSKTMRVLMLQEELVQLDPGRCRLLKRDGQMQ